MTAIEIVKICIQVNTERSEIIYSNRSSGSDASFIILTKSVKWRESRARTENLQNAVKPYHCSKCYCVCDHQFIQATY